MRKIKRGFGAALTLVSLYILINLLFVDIWASINDLFSRRLLTFSILIALLLTARVGWWMVSASRRPSGQGDRDGIMWDDKRRDSEPDPARPDQRLDQP